MNLQIPPEPINLRQEWKKELGRGGGKMNLARATLKQGTWITSPLWSDYSWKDELKKNGITWQTFMELYTNSCHHFINWAEGYTSWNKTLENFIIEVEREIARRS